MNTAADQLGPLAVGVVVCVVMAALYLWIENRIKGDRK